MMKENKRYNRAVRSALKLVGIGAALAAAHTNYGLSFQFTQDFSEGAQLTGQFSGTDTDGNGILSYNPGEGFLEVTDFGMSFSGNSLIAPFTLGFVDLDRLVFFLNGDGVIGDDITFDPMHHPFDVEGISAGNAVFTYLGGQGPLSFDGAFLLSLDSGEIDGADFGAAVTSAGPADAVPDSCSTLALLGISAFGLFGISRKRAAHS